MLLGLTITRVGKISFRGVVFSAAGRSLRISVAEIEDTHYPLQSIGVKAR